MASSSNSKHHKEYLRAVYEPSAGGETVGHLIDIVFVHGLNPLSKADFANATWTHENGNFWPSQQLPKRIPSARILVFSYNSQVAWDTNQNGIQEHAENLLDRLSGARESTRADKNYNTPIIFIAHSLGGLVVKQALVTAQNDKRYLDLRKSTHGLVFFAVPHQGGSGATLGMIAKRLVLALNGDANNSIVESLRSNSLFQENQAVFFKHQLEDYHIVSVYENRPTKLKGFFGKASALIIVDKKSATFGLPSTREKPLTVDSKHSEVCQFEDDNDKFEPVKRAIGNLADDAITKQKKAAADLSRADLQAQELLHSLHFTSIDSRQEQIADVHRETFKWIFDQSGDAVRPWSNFLEWLEKGQGTYWITGKAGSGKSTMMSYICQDSRTMDSLRLWAGTNTPKLLTPKFFFWNPGSELQKSSVGLLRSLLYQIIREYPEAATLPEKNEPLTDWTERRLRKIFQGITRHPPSSYRMCLFIDGLDEFSGDHEELIMIIQELVQNIDIKVVLSSRPHSNFDRAFNSGAMLKLQDLTRADIKRFVADKIDACSKVKSVTLQEAQSVCTTIIPIIINEFVTKADGVFLWVVLAVKDVIRGINADDSLEQLKKRLKSLPTKLEDLYAHLLNEIHDVHRQEAAWFLKFALLNFEAQWQSKTLIDFTLGTYEWLDYDLASWADFPSQDVISRCERTRRRIMTTCTGLLEVCGAEPDSNSNLDTDSDSDSDSETETATNIDVASISVSDCDSRVAKLLRKNIPENMTHVTFLHRTVAEFLARSEQGMKFLNRNTSADRNVFVVWAKVLVARARVFGFYGTFGYGTPHDIEAIMEAASDAEYETGLAQTAVCDYIERAMEIIDPKKETPPPETDSCLRIFDWASQKHEIEYTNSEYLQVDVWKSSSIHVKTDSSSMPVPAGPVDYLGFAASRGLRYYVEHQLKSLPANRRLITVDYLLICAINSLRSDPFSDRLTRRTLDAICTILKYGGNPNTRSFKNNTIWGCFLAFTFGISKYRASNIDHEIALKTSFTYFMEYGADMAGTLSTWSPTVMFLLHDNHRHLLSNAAAKLMNCLDRFCQYRFHIDVSVPTLVWYCLGDSPTSAELVSFCMLNGASYHSKVTKISIGFVKYGRARPADLETWALSQEQSDRLLKVYERDLKSKEKSYEASWAIDDEFLCQILLLYNELSARKSDCLIDE